MSEKEIGIRLTAKDALSKSMRGIGQAVKQTESSFKTFAQRASNAVESVTRKIFFLREAITTVTGLLKGFWNAFIGPALRARQLSASLTNVFGGGTAARIKAFSKETGLAFEAVSKGALDAGKAIEKAGGMEAYLRAVERVSKWRPDLGAEGAVAFVNNLVNKVGEVTEGSAKQLGRYTSVVIGGTKAQAVDLAAELDKLGVINRVTDPALTAFDKLKAAWDAFKASVGERVLDKLAEGALKLLDWLTQNEDKIVSLTEKFTDLINLGLQKLIDWLDSDGPDKLIATFSNLADQIIRASTAFEPLAQGIGNAGQSISNPYAGGGGVGKAGLRAAGGTIARPRQALGRAAMTLKQLTTIGAFGLGHIAGGRPLGAALARGTSSIPTASERQRVQVTVGVDPRNGNVTAYVDDRIEQNNAEVVNSWGGGNRREAMSWGGGR